MHMHMVSVVNLRINRKHLCRSVDRLVSAAGIAAVRGGPEPTVGSSQLWNSCPFVAIFCLPRQPP